MHTREEKLEAFGRFLDVLDTLREKCPWDKKQTNQSLRTNTIEEVFELSDALMKDDTLNICKELGDVFLHICFYAKIGEEKSAFDIADVCNKLADKLIFRHPHVYHPSLVGASSPKPLPYGEDDKPSDMQNADTAQKVIENWEQIKLKEKDGNTYDLLGWDLKDSPIYPPAEGVDYVYGEEGGTVGWNVNCITTTAENPQRIFDLYSWMLTKDGSINMMYGPEGGLWEGKDEEGNPILKKPEEELTSDEKNAAGCWFWSQPAHSDNVDLTKYAVNDQQPEESRSWVISIQNHVFTPEDSIHPAVPGQKFLTDENTNLSLEIDPNDDLGMARQAITDECKMRIPQIIMASDDATFDKLVQDLKDFAESNQVHDIEKIYTDKRASNIELQGYTAYQDYYDAKK